MNKIAMALLTKDKVELSKQTVRPLLQPDKFDLFWIDGSDTVAGKNFLREDEYHAGFGNVRGGAGAALVFALTEMLKGPYDYVGLCEQDTFLPMDWFPSTFDLFARGSVDGLPVGSVSARCYVDRVLFQRDGFAVLHNAGAGHVLFSRQAAEIVLNAFRSGWTTDNRRIFCQLSELDIGPWWAFKNGDHPLTADWKWDSDLAAHGLASLALTPSHVEMIGQNPPLAEQGLAIVKQPVISRIDDAHFNIYRGRLQAIHHGVMQVNVETTFSYSHEQGGWSYLAHQLHMIGGKFSGDWRFKEMRAYGEFCWVSGATNDTLPSGYTVGDNLPTCSIPVFGLASLLVSGGKNGGQIEITDENSGYSVAPYLPAEGDTSTVVQIPLPAQMSYRRIKLTAKHPGVCFYKLTTQNKQPVDPTQKFDYSILPVPV